MKRGRDKADRATPAARLRRRATKRRARYRARGAVVQYPYRLDAIYERDAWICWICGTPVDRGAVVPFHQAPTVDHVLALALGGDDTAANVRLAHFICNTRRGVGLPGGGVAAKRLVTQP